MRKITIPSTDLGVAELGMGCEQLGGYGWGNFDVSAAQRAVGVALDAGINFFDTADVYGTGLSESNLGAALRGRRGEAVLCSKFGVRLDNQKKAFYDLSPAWLDQALEASLRRLQTDYLDLYLAHYPDPRTPWPVVFEALEKKRREGKIRYYGVSNLPPADLPTVLESRAVALQMEMSLCRQENDRLIRFALASGKLLPIFYGCLAQGLLSGKYGRDQEFPTSDRRTGKDRYVNWSDDNYDQNLALVETLRKLAEKRGRKMVELAVRWLLDNYRGSVALVGIKHPEQLADLLPVLDWMLDAADLSVLGEQGAHAPLAH